MLIDWITCRVPMEFLSDQARSAAQELGDRIVRYCPKSGEVRHETAAWVSVRSDSHQIACRAGTDFWIQGSPARCIGDGCSVFGAGPSRLLDIRGCVARMAAYAGEFLGAGLPSPDCFAVTRVDVTGNLHLDSLAEVRHSLAMLRDCEGGRYRVSQQAGDTVYWSKASKLRKGKAYAKGPHLEHLMRQKTYTGHRYSTAEIEAACRLLRLELTLGREWFARNHWITATPQVLADEWENYFGRMIGGAEMTCDNDIKDRVLDVAPSEGQGRAAYGCWTMIKSEGWERARECFSKPTWYRHLKILRKAGLADADISAGQVVPLRRRVIEARLVHDWADIAA